MGSVLLVVLEKVLELLEIRRGVAGRFSSATGRYFHPAHLEEELAGERIEAPVGFQCVFQKGYGFVDEIRWGGSVVLADPDAQLWKKVGIHARVAVAASGQRTSQGRKMCVEKPERRVY